MISFDQEKGDPLAGTEFMFSEKSVRNGFIRKVYSILLMQLLVTTGFIAAFAFTPGVKEYLRSPSGSWLYGVSLMGVIVFLLAMACIEKARRSWPTNIICLMGFIMAVLYVDSQFDTAIVMMAIVITALVTLGLTLYALQTKYDYTAWGGALFVCLFALIGVGFMAMFLPGKMVQIVYSSAGAVLFGMYIIFDTQMMMGGKHKYSISPEDYIFASLNLYLDIINLFLHILSLLNQSNRN